MFFEEQRARLRDNFVFWSLSLGSFAAVLFVLSFAYMSYVREQHHQAESLAQYYTYRLEQTLNDIGVITQSLAVAAEVHSRENVEEDDLQTHINRLMELYPYLSGLQVAPEGVVTLETRIRSETDSLRGVNLLESPFYKFDAQRAVNQTDSSGISVVGPVELKNSDLGVYVRVPVFHKGGANKREFWGFVQASVRLDNLLSVSGFDQLARTKTPFELWKEDEDTGDRWLFFYSPKADMIDGAISVGINIHDNHWFMAVNDPMAGSQSVYLALILLASSLSSGGVAYAVKKRQTKRKALWGLLAKQKDRFRHLTALVNLYQNIFDAADAGFVQWDKNKCLETWNVGFEKMYPKLAPYLGKGMTRKALYTLRAQFGESEMVTDWETTGTWYRQLKDGRIIMLKRTAMPDGGRLGMHMDMTASLGDQDYENSMLLKISVAPDVLRLNAFGFFCLDEAKRTFLEMLDALAYHKMHAALFDGSDVEGDPLVMERFYTGEFANEEFKKAIGKISADTKFAYVFKGVRPSFERGMLNAKVFGNVEDALVWLDTSPDTL